MPTQMPRNGRPLPCTASVIAARTPARASRAAMQARKAPTPSPDIVQLTGNLDLGVDPAIFDTFYHVVMATFRDILSADWTTEMEVTWTRIISELTTPPE